MSVESKVIRNDFSKLVKQLGVGGSKYNEVKSTFKKLAVNEASELQKVLPVGASSNLVNSVFNDVKTNQYNFDGVVGAKASYGLIAAETGRKPGKMPPPKALERWALQKFGDRKAAFAIAKKIKKKGTRRFINKGPKLITQFQKKVSDQSIPQFIKQVGNIIIK